MSNIIEIKNLSFEYDHNIVLENVNLSIKKGEFVGIIGPNGGGKTTLLKLILGFLPPNKGSVRISGKLSKEVQHNIGYVPQFHEIDRYFPITVYELVLLGAISTCNWLGKYPNIIKKKAKKLLKDLNLSKIMNSPFGKLSGGQMQRVLIARALISDPEILILDEPTSNIDEKSLKQIFKLLLDPKSNRTILIVSHDLKAIFENITKVLCVQRSVSTLKPKEVCEHFSICLHHSPNLQKMKTS